MCNLSEGVDEHRDLHFGGELNDGMLLNYFIQTKIKQNSFVEVLSHKHFILLFSSLYALEVFSFHHKHGWF